MKTAVYLELSEYLSAHEEDIADGINDFGDLRLTFNDIMDREPRPSVVITPDEIRFIQKRIKDAGTKS